MVYFLGSNQQDYQEYDSINISNVGARTTIICKNKKDYVNKQIGNTNPDQTNTDTADNGSKGEGPNYLNFLITHPFTGPKISWASPNCFAPEQNLFSILYRAMFKKQETSGLLEVADNINVTHAAEIVSSSLQGSTDC